MTPLRTDNPDTQPDAQVLLRRGAWAAALFHLAFAAFVLLKLPSAHWHTVGNDVVECLGGMLSVALCFLGRKRRRSRPNPADTPQTAREVWMPRLFAASLICYTIGQSIDLFQRGVLHKTSTDFSACDVWYLLSYAPLLAGIVLLPTQPLPASARPRIVLDALMSITALVTFSWHFLLGPMLIQKHVSASSKFVAMSYPTLDLVSIFCMLILGHHAMPRVLRRAAAVICAGLMVTTISDSMISYQNLHSMPLGGNLLVVGWSLGYCILALAVSAVRLFPNACRHAQDDAPRPAMLWQSLLPYAFLPAVGALLLGLRHSNADARLTLGVYAGASLLVVLVLLRQIMAILENHNLNSRLAAAYAGSMEQARQMRGLNDALVTTQSQLHDNLEALTRANERLERLAETDAVSGLLNHRGMAAALDMAQVHARQSARPCALLFLDVDHFKALNDSFGHPAGDAALHEVGLVLQETLRASATLGRWGGEEFLALLPGADLADALLAAEAVRAAIAAHVFGIAGGLHLTCSIGVAALPRHAPDWTGLVDAADQAMYQAKHSGRNQVCAAGEDDLSVPPGVSPSGQAPSRAAASAGEQALSRAA